MIAFMEGKDVECSCNVDEKVVCPTIHKTTNMANKDSIDEEERTRLFHVKVQVKKTKVDALFDTYSQANLIAEELVQKLGLETYDHPHPYPLGWVHKDVELQVKNQICD
eukprot:Gb_27715 [translate_table: standard]